MNVKNISSRAQAIRAGHIYGQKYAETYIATSENLHVGAINKAMKSLAKAGVSALSNPAEVPNRWKTVFEDSFVRTAQHALEVHGKNIAYAEAGQ